MQQPEISYETHTLRFPFANVIFGRVFEMPCDITFEYAESEDGFRINIKSLTGTGEDGTRYDLLYLTEDEDSMYSGFIVSCVYSNKINWDLTKTGEEEWWELQSS